MNGTTAYILSKKYTDNTVVGLGALKGAPCQVQSTEKVDGVTTVTLKWKDNEDVDHTTSFDIDDGGEIQYDSFPTASVSELGNIYQYTGTTTSDFVKGYFYECVYEDSAYKWKQLNTQDPGSAEIETDPIDFNDF